MLKKLLFIFGLSGQLFLHGGLSTDIDRASSILSEQQIPCSVLRRAKGVVVMSVVKGGFIFSGRVGKGLVVAKAKSGWSAPSALGIGGAGWGFQAGVEVTDFVLVLNTQSALDAFASGGSISLGGNLSIAAGPIGGSAEGSLSLPPAAMFYYGKSYGAFAGASLEGTIMVSRSGANQQFYGRNYSVQTILFGDVPPPKRAQNLYQALSCQ